MGERPKDWSLLDLSADPTPGDPDVLTSVADYMKRMAAHAELANNGLQQVVTTSGDGAFVGKTADWLREQITTEMRGFVAGVRQAFTEAETAVRTYVTALRETQSRADRALTDAASAAGDEDRLRTLAADAATARDDLTQAARKLQAAVRAAAAQVKSPKTPKSACDVFWEVFGWITLVISVVAIIIGGPIGLLAWGMNIALAAKSTVDFITGKTNALGFVLGLLNLLGPSTRGLTTLAKLRELPAKAWKTIKEFVQEAPGRLRTAVDDFWNSVTLLSLMQKADNLADIGTLMAKSTESRGGLAVLKAIDAEDALAARGFVTLKNTTLAERFSARLSKIGTSLSNGWKGLWDFDRHFGGDKWLRIFLPLEADEIAKFGVRDAFKLSVLERGLSLKPNYASTALTGGVRLAEGITTVTHVKPGVSTSGGDIRLSPSGLHLPPADLVEHTARGVGAPGPVGVSANGAEFAGVRAPVTVPDLAGTGLPAATSVNAGVVGVPGTAGAVDLNQFVKVAAPVVNALDNSIGHLRPATLGVAPVGAAPIGQTGDLAARLSTFSHGLDSLSSFARSEIRAWSTGDVSAVRISDTGVSFNVGVPQGAAARMPDGQAVTTVRAGAEPMAGVNSHLPGTAPATAGAHLDVTTPRTGGTTAAGAAITVPATPQARFAMAMDLLGETPPSAGTRIESGAPAGSDRGAAGTAPAPAHRADPSSVSGVGRPDQAGRPNVARTDVAGRPDQAGSNLGHGLALDRLQQARQALAHASDDPLALARAEKDLRVAESLVQRNQPSPATPGEPPVPPHTIDADLADLDRRLARLRGADEAGDRAGLELSARLEQLRRGPAAGSPPESLDLPVVPDHQIDQGILDLDRRLADLRGGDAPALDPGRWAADSGTAQARTDQVYDPSMFPEVPTIAGQRLDDLQRQLDAARAEQAPGTPESAGTRWGELEARMAALRETDGTVPAMPHAPTGKVLPPPGVGELAGRLKQLRIEARQAGLPADEVRVFTGDVRKALDEGRPGDAAQHLIDMHDRIDMHILDRRLDSFRAHVDAGHDRAAQLGMDRVTWLEHAVGVERAAVAGDTARMHQLLNAYEKALGEHLAVQKGLDLPVPSRQPAPGSADAAGSPGPATEADLQARLDSLRGGPGRGEVDLQARLDALRSGGHHTDPAALPELPEVPRHLVEESGLAQRLAELRRYADEQAGMSPAESKRWSDELAGAGDETAAQTVLTRYHERLTELQRATDLAEIRAAGGPLPADEQLEWLATLERAGQHPHGANLVADSYRARLTEFRDQTADRINAALSAPDHLRALNSRLDEALSGLSREIRDGNAAAYAPKVDELARLRREFDAISGTNPRPDATAPAGDSVDAPWVFPDVPSAAGKAGDSVDAPWVFPDVPSPVSGADDLAAEVPVPATATADDLASSTSAPSAPVTRAPDTVVPPRDTPTVQPGSQVAEIPRAAAPAGDATTGPARQLLGDGRPAGTRVIEVNSERWTPLSDAFRFEPAAPGQPARIVRPEGGGERIAARYQLAAGDDEWRFTVRVHLTGASPDDLAVIRDRTAEGVEHLLNAPGHRLPGTDVPMRVEVEFVDDPSRAHAHVKVTDDLDRMNQNTWARGASPAAYAHEVVHHLGVKDTRPPAGALLHSVAQVARIPGDLMNTHHPDSAYVLTPDSLAQIAEVLAPHFSESPVPRSLPTAVDGTESFWRSGVDLPPNVTHLDEPAIPSVAAPAAEITRFTPINAGAAVPGEALKGLYQQRPDLLFEVDSIADLNRVSTDLTRHVETLLAPVVSPSWTERLLGRPGTVDVTEIGRALRTDPQSFFVTGGRTFDLVDSGNARHTVTIEPLRDLAAAEFVSQSDAKAKFDTRIDQAVTTKEKTDAGAPGSLVVGAMLPQRIGYGFGGGVDIALARPSETSERSDRVTDSRNIRSGGVSHLVRIPVRFTITAAGQAPPAHEAALWADTVVMFRAVDDLIKATVASGSIPITGAQTALLVESMTPVRIIGAQPAPPRDPAAAEQPAGTAPPQITGTWNAVVGTLLRALQPSRTVEPGTHGAESAHKIFDESSIIANLMPALNGPVHLPPIISPDGRHRVSLRLAATVTSVTVLAGITKASARWQPGLVTGERTAHTSRVGTGLWLVPVRYGFDSLFAQLRLYGSFHRSATATVGESVNSRIGTEFKDVKDVAAQVRFQLHVTAEHQHAMSLHGPHTAGEAGTYTVELDVFARMPQARVDELAAATRVFKAPEQTRYLPPYVFKGGRSTVYGLSGFDRLYEQVTQVVRDFEGGFLPRYGQQEVSWTRKTVKLRERYDNQAALDRVLSPDGLRQAMPSLLTTGLIAELTRTRKGRREYLVLRVKGRYVGTGLRRLGTLPQVAVRTSQADTGQQRSAAGGQLRFGGAVEGGGILRIKGSVSTALVAAGGLDGRYQGGAQSGSQLTGQESRLNGGTAHSEAFEGDLRITVDLYSYTSSPRHDPASLFTGGRKVRRTVRQTVPAGPAAQTGPAQTGPEYTGLRYLAGHTMSRYRFTEQRPVTALYDQATVLTREVTPAFPILLNRPDPLGIRPAAAFDLSRARDWVDDGHQVPVRDWLSVEAMPAAKMIYSLAKNVLRALQDGESTNLLGVSGLDSLLKGMPLWTQLRSRLPEHRQVGALRSMLGSGWHIGRLLGADDGADIDLVVVAALSDPEVLPAYATIATESASTGGVEIEGAQSSGVQFAVRGALSAALRKPFQGPKSGGSNAEGGMLSGAHEQILHATTHQDSASMSGAIERNVNNRKGKTRSFLVKFNLRVTVGAEVATRPGRYRIIPESLRTGTWLRRYRSAQRDGTILDAVYLRLSADQMAALGLLPAIDDGTGRLGAPWLPAVPVPLRPAHGYGLGLYTVREAPALTDLQLTPAADGDPFDDRLIERVRAALSPQTLADSMLNRRRLQALLTPDGIARNWASMLDGGVSVLHVRPGTFRQDFLDIRVRAELVGDPQFEGYVASHDDLDIKTVHVQDGDTALQRRHGGTTTATASGTGVVGDTVALGGSDTVGRVSQTTTTQSHGQTVTEANLSSGRGVKARMRLRAKFFLQVFHDGRQTRLDLPGVHSLVQDRWADEVRPPRPRPEVTSVYRIQAPEHLGIGWRDVNGLPVPARVSPEQITRTAELQQAVQRLLDGAAKRLAESGFAGSLQIHQSLSPEFLLPAVARMLSDEGLDLPVVASAQFSGEKAKINIRLVPHAVSLSGISSGVYREHATQLTDGYRTGDGSLVQNLHVPRVLAGRGQADDPYQALESGGIGVGTADTHGTEGTGGATAGGLGNVKPESPSALLDYLCRAQITVKLPRTFGSTRTVATAAAEGIPLLVALRMGLHEAPIALGLPESTLLARDFQALAADEAEMAARAGEFLDRADRLDQARYEACATERGTDERAAAEARIPALATARDVAADEWLRLVRRHQRLLDAFSGGYLGHASRSDPAEATRLARDLQPSAFDAPPMVEIDAERWTPLADAFTFEPAAPGERPVITRPASSGERVIARYQLTVGDQWWRFRIRVHLSGAAPDALAALRANVVAGVERYLNEPGHRLPGTDARMRVEVEFVTDPAQAHARISITDDLSLMNQNTWALQAAPAEYAHELVHYLGVNDTHRRARVLLRRVVPVPAVRGDLMGVHGDGVDYALTADSLQQIVDVLAPHVSESLGTRTASVAAGDHTVPFGEAGVDLPPDVTMAPAGGVLEGVYAARPEYLYEVDEIVDLSATSERIVTSVQEQLRTGPVAGWRETFRRRHQVSAAEIGEALKADPQSFFATGGRSFDIQDDRRVWRRVTVEPVRMPGIEPANDEADAAAKAKFDTRTDHQTGVKETVEGGVARTIAASVMFPQKVGFGAGGGAEVRSAAPSRTAEFTERTGQSHNVRSGSTSKRMSVPVDFRIIVSTADRRDVVGFDEVLGEPFTKVLFRSVGDLATAQLLAERRSVEVPEHSALAEQLTPLRILSARLADESTPADRTWNDCAEQILTLLAPSRAADPGTGGADVLREVLSDASIVEKLMTSLGSPVHPPAVYSENGKHRLSLKMTSKLTNITGIAEITKSSFRWTTGSTTGSKIGRVSRVGAGLVAIPFRMAWGIAYLQGRFRAAFQSAAANTVAQSSATQVGTEFKDVPNVVVEARFQLTIEAGQHHVLGFHRRSSATAVPPVVIDLNVLARLPKTAMDELARPADLVHAASAADTAQQRYFPPPYAEKGSRSVTDGLDNAEFISLRTDIDTAIRSFPTGFLPVYEGLQDTRTRADEELAEQQKNQAKLDKVLTVDALRSRMTDLLGTGLTTHLTRTMTGRTHQLTLHVQARYADGDFTHVGLRSGYAVRTSQVDTTQQKSSTAAQWQISGGVEGVGILRKKMELSAAMTLGGGVEARYQHTAQSGVQLVDRVNQLNGGTPASHTFSRELIVTASVYAVVRRPGIDRAARRPGQVVRELRRRNPGQPMGTHSTVKITADRGPRRGRVDSFLVPRYRFVRRNPVTVSFDEAAVTTQRVDVDEPVLDLRRVAGSDAPLVSAYDPGAIRAWVDETPASAEPAGGLPITDWLSVESIPGAEQILNLAETAIKEAQKRAPGNKIDGLRGDYSLQESMGAWVALRKRLSPTQQISGLSAMLNGAWYVDQVVSEANGRSVDLVLAATLVNARILGGFGEIATETASTGGVEIEGSDVIGTQVAVRGLTSLTGRKPYEPKPGATDTGGTDATGGVVNAGYDHLIRSGTKRVSGSVAGTIERNVNERKGKVPTFPVLCDMRLSGAAVVGLERFRPRAVRLDATVSSVVCLRLTAEQLRAAGLLPRLAGDAGVLGDGWRPDEPPLLRPAYGSGLGLYAVQTAPKVDWELADTPVGAAGIKPQVLARVRAALSGAGLSDTMLNRRRLQMVLSPGGIARHWPSLVDGGLSVLHTTPDWFTRSFTDIRVHAEIIGAPEFEGFLADHADLDVKTTFVRDGDVTRQRGHGGTTVLGAGGTGVTGEVAHGGGYSGALASQSATVKSRGDVTAVANVSSARGVKARLRYPVRFHLQVFHQGKSARIDLKAADYHLVQHVWAEDLRDYRPGADNPRNALTSPGRVRTYEIPATERPAGWQTANGLPIPMRCSPEDLTGVAALQESVVRLLAGKAKQLAEPGYAGATQIHQALSPELLLPAMSELLSEEGFTLPTLTSAQIFGRQAKIKIRFVPYAVSLRGISSAVYREHVGQHSTGHSSGRLTSTQHSHLVPRGIVGGGQADDPYQALESAGIGPVVGFTHAAEGSGSDAAASSGNAKPEGRSALVDYLGLAEVTVVLSGTFLPDRLQPTETVRTERPKAADQPDPAATETISVDAPMLVSLRMGLHEAADALGIHVAGNEQMRIEFEALSKRESEMVKPGGPLTEFMAASVTLSKLRYQGVQEEHRSGGEPPEGLAAAVTAYERAAERWWTRLQELHVLLDTLRDGHLGVAMGQPGAVASENTDARQRRVTTALTLHRTLIRQAEQRNRDLSNRPR